ncbi:MAG: Amuc_1098 family type IV pilus outer membrane protein [Verrucomicrobiota bacterium]
METFKPNHSIRGRAALLASACLVFPLLPAHARDAEALASNELSKRSIAIQEAQELLQKGDEAYTLGNYGDAVTAYAGARNLIPDAPISAELRDAATLRYAQASVEHARDLARAGDLAGAKATVDKVLDKSVAPDNPGALAYRTQLDDPIRTNPALTKEHGQNIDQVRRLLYTAEGAYNLGKFDQAKSTYESVIRIDPTNSAARRGLERVAQAKSDYAKSAYDHTRAEMLAQVDAGWEIPPTPLDVDPAMTDVGFSEISTDLIPVRNKLDRIIIPKFAIEQATLDEALDLLRVRAAENDTLESNPASKGVNITVSLGDGNSPEATRIRNTRFDLQLSQVPLAQVLNYICNVTGTTFSTDDFAVNISPAGSTSTALVTRSYRVPPDFISSISTATSATPQDDPFAEAPAGGLLATRLGIQETLTQQGVLFPEGASAKLIAGTLRVVNTEQNQAYIAQIIETATSAEPIMVSVSVTMIKVQEDRLQELGFDWLLNNFGFGGEAWVPGQDKLNLTGGTIGNGRPLTDIPLEGYDTVRNPITSGNRSGDFAVNGNSIDQAILNSGSRQVSNSAPGVLAVRGEINEATVAMLMRGLNQSNGVDLVARPSVVTRSGQSSSVSVIREFPYPTEYEPPELPNSTGGEFGFGGGSSPVTPATPTAFDNRDVGISMEVLPVVDENKQYVNLTINPVFTEFDGFVNYGSPINTTASGLLGPETVQLTENAILEPVFSVKRLKTSVDVLDGATLVLGGLIQDNNQNVEDQVPILGSIPVIGRLFQSKVTKKTTTAIVFLVNVQVVDPMGRVHRDR